MNEFRRRVKARRWTYEAFALHFGRAAVETAELKQDHRIAAVSVSHRSFTRWMASDLKGLPNSETCLVLEHLLGLPAEDLFGAIPQPAATASVALPTEVAAQMPEPVGARFVDPSLVPHWTGMLQILATTHNAFGPSQLHQTAVHEMSVIGQFRQRTGGQLFAALLAVESRWAEFASWTAENTPNGPDAGFWLDRSLQLAQDAGHTQLVSYVRMRQAQRAVERHEVSDALSLAGQAWQAAGENPRDRALCAVRQAQAHALAGDGRGSRSAIAEAAKLVDLADMTEGLDDPSTIGRHCVSAYVQAHEASCQMLLGEFALAASALEQVLGTWPAGFRQDELLAQVWLAVSYFNTGRLAEAGSLGSEVLSANATVGSSRVHRGLRQLALLAGRADQQQPELRTFRSSLALIPPRM
ncbi:tetratricopeptide repeat protein [Kitasatospora sp. NPDC003701]